MFDQRSRKGIFPVGIKVAIGLIFISGMTGCATNPSPDAAGPRTGDAAYPARLIDENGERREAAIAIWANFTISQGIQNAPQPELQPVTATLKSIPDLSQTPILLPRVGAGDPMNEEETRESLRRFIAEAGPLLCNEPQLLSLIERVDGADGIKQAFYKQRPFRYSIHRGYGELRISFRSDRRITQLSSTCIPEIERVRRGFVGLGQLRATPEKAVESLVGRVVTYADSSGQQQTYAVDDKTKLNVRGLVIFPIERKGDPPALEIRSAWEIVVESSPTLTIYLDSILGEILGTELGRPA